MVESCGIKIRFFLGVGSGIKVISSLARAPIFLALNGRRGGKARLEERERGIMMASLIQPTKLGREGWKR